MVMLNGLDYPSLSGGETIMLVHRVFPTRHKKSHYAVPIGVTGKSYLLCRGIPTFGTHSTEHPLNVRGEPKPRSMCKLCTNMLQKHDYVSLPDEIESTIDL